MTHSILEDFNEGESFAFWTQWFTANGDRARQLLGDYLWPHPLKEYDAVLDGRTCPFCHGNGYKYLEPDQIIDDIAISQVYCVCSVLGMMENQHVYESSWIPSKVADIKEYGTTEVMKSIGGTKAMVRYFMKYPLAWNYLYGGFGAGKTHMLQSIKTYFRGLAIYITASDLNSLIFETTGTHTLHDLTNKLIEAPILLIDDIGKEFPGSYLYSTLFRVIDARYNMKYKAPIFCTSNKTQMELMMSTDDHMKACADRLSDRLLVNSIATKQASYRQAGPG